MIREFNRRYLRLDEDGDKLEESLESNSEPSPKSTEHLILRQRLSTRCINFTAIDKFDSRRVMPQGIRVGCTGNFDVVLADLGYNMVHLANAEWGFSYMNPGKLDMRYSEDYRSCADILSGISEFELTEILRMYG